MVYFDAVQKASLDKFISDERKIILMDDLVKSGRKLFDEPDKVQRFFARYIDAYDEYTKDIKNIEKIIILREKYDNNIDDNEYEKLIDFIDNN